MTDLEALKSVGTSSGDAREAAFRAAEAVAVEPTSLISYQSKGRVLIIGEQTRALAIAQALSDRLRCCVLATDRVEPGEHGVPVFYSQGREVRLAGHLGEFMATVATDQGEANVALGVGAEHFDLVLDLGAEPLLTMAAPPFGYYAPAGDDERLQRALAEMPDLVGDFEKATFFAYNPDICAHGRSGLKGCNRCLETCPTGAITSLVDKIAVDPYLCQGGGGCATVCPTGAIVYSFPQPADTVNRLRVLLRTYREHGGSEPVLLLHDAEAGKACVSRLWDRLPEHVMPIEVEEVASVGMDAWLSALAFGAARVLLLEPETLPSSVAQALDEQQGFARALLEGMGYPGECLDRIRIGSDEDMLARIAKGATMPPIEPAGFAGSNEKRATLFHAIDYLFAQAPQPADVIALSHRAPFGKIQVNRDTCTLCMACVSVCPASALHDGAGVPKLDFVEANCVQCGLCETACPEDAITRQPRFLFDREQRRQRRLLNEEAIFHCIACGVGFATRSMIEKMVEKLSGHWMFQDDAALRRLKMCGDCRVKDMFDDKGA